MTSSANIQKDCQPYDPRGLLACDCGELCAYRLLREGDKFLSHHRGHGGIVVLRDRRPGWRRASRRGS